MQNATPEGIRHFLGALIMPLFGFTSSMAVEPLTDRFVSLSVGSTLFLKTCGFVEAYDARILDVADGSLRLRIGNRWYERILLGTSEQKPIEITFKFRDVDDEAERDAARHQRPQARYSAIEVVIRPASLTWSHESFQDAARRLMFDLRSYFMAC